MTELNDPGMLHDLFLFSQKSLSSPACVTAAAKFGGAASNTPISMLPKNPCSEDEERIKVLLSRSRDNPICLFPPLQE
jgi:hypothetical protein